jgi:hypothetical protein
MESKMYFVSIAGLVLAIVAIAGVVMVYIYSKNKKGPVGNTGGTGDAGETGTAGTPGIPGIPGTSPLDAFIQTTAGSNDVTFKGNVTVTGNITTTVGDISTSTGNITTTTGDISTSSGNITTDTGNITTTAGGLYGANIVSYGNVNANGWFYGLTQDVGIPKGFIAANRGLTDPIYTIDTDGTTVHFPGDVYSGLGKNLYTGKTGAFLSV